MTVDRHVQLQVLLHQHAVLLAASHRLSLLGEPVTVGVVVAAATVVLGVRRDAVRAVALPVVSLALLLLGQLARHLIGRTAPTSGSHLHVPGGQGYPSGHALGAALTVGAVALVVRRTWVTVAAAVLAVLTAAARVYLFAHFTSDVVASLLAGVAGLAAVEALAASLSTPRRGAGPRTPSSR